MTEPDTILPHTEDAIPLLYAEEAEDATLACAMYDARTIPAIRAVLSEGGAEFWKLGNRQTWEAILAVHDRGDNCNTITVAAELRGRQQLDGVGAYRLSSLTFNLASAIHATVYAGIVQRMAIKRKIAATASEMVRTVFDGQLDSSEILGRARKSLDKVGQHLSVVGYAIDGDALAAKAMDEFESWVTNPSTARGLSCGIPSIDNLIGGFQDGNVIGILAETSMGKSTLTSGFVRNFAHQGPGCFVPTETPGKVAFHKMALDMAGIPYKVARTGKLTEAQQQRAYEAYADLMAQAHNIKVIDDSAPSMDAVRSQVMSMLSGPGCRWLVVDSGSKFAKSLGIAAIGDNLYKATTVASGFLQDMARLGIPVVATWQIGRSTKGRNPNKGTGLEPTIHDGKDSGAVEEDTDVLLGLYRHEYWVNRKEAEPDDLRYPPGTAKLILLKDRNGSDGNEELTLNFKGGRGFTDEGISKIDLSRF